MQKSSGKEKSANLFVFFRVYSKGVSSRCIFKAYLNDFLLELESRALGKFIGDLYMGCPTIADGLLFLSSSDTEWQLMYNLARINSQEKRYIIHPQKSAALRWNVTCAVHNSEVVDSWALG